MREFLGERNQSASLRPLRLSQRLRASAVNLALTGMRPHSWYTYATLTAKENRGGAETLRKTREQTRQAHPSRSRPSPLCIRFQTEKESKAYPWHIGRLTVTYLANASQFRFIGPF